MTIKLGDTVKWSGGFGTQPSKEVKVTGIEHCPNGGKYGHNVPEIDAANKDACVFDLDNGHWAYGKQIQLNA